MKHPLFLFLTLLSVSLFSGAAFGQREGSKLKANLDPLLTLPSAWEITPDKLDEMFKDERMEKNPYFKWLTEDRSRAIFQRKPFSNLTIGLTIFDEKVPIEEAIIDFEDGKLLGVTISIFNRGDGGTISVDDFNERFKVAGKQIGEMLEIRPFRRDGSGKDVLTSGWVWISGAGMAVLEHNPKAPETIEFLRMRLARRDAKGVYAAAMEKRAGAAVSVRDLPNNVEKDNKGNVIVTNLPMVDQGQKGYCAVASAQRIFEYYGIPCDQHQIAQIAGSDPNRGTSAMSIIEEMSKVDSFFQTRFETLALRDRGGLVELEDLKYVGDKVDEKDFHKMIHKYIDAGIPLLWALELGRYKEIPDISQQAGGGHMRIIHGYNDKENRVIFTDSWGAGHEFKTMDANDCYKATSGLFLFKPTK